MALLLVLLFLSALLPPSHLQDGSENNELENLSTINISVQEEIVNKHNELRRMVYPSGSDLLKMEWNRDAQVIAQEWANKCMFSHSPIEFRTINLRCGENLFMADYPASWSSVIQDWYDETKDFTFGVGPNDRGSPVGHYTQVVWNTTFQVACGFAVCPQNPMKYLYVCHYCPAGNNLRRIYKPYTVGAPCASCPDHCEDGLCTNSCGYEDKYSNCLDMKRMLTCKDQMLKDSCKATCYCEDKIH